MLERLKHTPATRHIPVYVITTDEDRERGLRAGALGVALKPIQTQDVLDEILATLRRHREQSTRSILLIEPDPASRERLRAYLPGGRVELLEAGSATEALEPTTDCRTVVSVVRRDSTSPVRVVSKKDWLWRRMWSNTALRTSGFMK